MDSLGMEHHSTPAVGSIRLSFQQCVRIQNWAASWMETQLETRGRKLERASRREVFSRERRKMLLPRTQPSYASWALHCQQQVFYQAAREEDAVCVHSPCDIPVITVTCRWLTPAVTEAA